MKSLRIFLLVILTTSILFSQNKGNLLIIGGGSIPAYILEKYVELAGGKESTFLVIPMASAEPVQSANSFANKLRDAGCTKIEYLIFNRETADSDSNIAKVNNAKGIFFTGGDQSKLTAVLLGTKLLESIKTVYRKGGVIGGTSAGAAVMSTVMITGKELINKDTVNAYNVIKKGNIQTVAGLGFLNNAIVDQHFIKRKRMQRLISLVLENPKLTGIGIDESTSIILNPSGSFTVLGEGLVAIFEAFNAKDVMTDKNNNQSAKNITMHLLKSGDKYSFANRKEKRKAKQ